MRKLLLLAAMAATSVAGLVAAMTVGATNGPPEKITICHVAGLASDPANYITLELPPQAVYGNGGHFNEDGTPQAGHEQDSFGACNPPPPPHDECENIPGNQPEGYDCTPPEDLCTNIEGVQETVPEGMVRDENGECHTPTTPPCQVNCSPPPRVCPDGGPPTPGEGAYDPNDDCKRKPPETPPVTTTPTPVETTPTPTTPTVTTPTPTVTPPAAKPPVVKTSSKTKTPKPDKLAENPSKGECEETDTVGVVKCETTTGKTVTVVGGSG